MGDPRHDPSIEHEPHLRGGIFESDSSEHTVEPILDRRLESEADKVEHSVWDEPALNKELAGPSPKDARTFARWLAYHRAETTLATSRWVVLLVAAVSGPIAVFAVVFGEIFQQFAFLELRFFQLVVISVVAPLSEEVFKSAATLWVIEKRPYLFKSARQVMFCVISSALCFAVFENFLYLLVYIENPSEMLVLWRWTICVALHVSCSAISGVGLVRVWSETMTHLKRPELSLWFPMIVAASVFHGIYNFAVFFFEKTTNFF